MFFGIAEQRSIRRIFVRIPAIQTKMSALYEVNDGAFFISIPNGSIFTANIFSPQSFIAKICPNSCNSAAKNGRNDNIFTFDVSSTAKKIKVGKPILIFSLLSIFYYRHHHDYKKQVYNYFFQNITQFNVFLRIYESYHKSMNVLN